MNNSDLVLREEFSEEARKLIFGFVVFNVCYYS